MRRRNLLLWISPFLYGMLVLAGESSTVRGADALRSFYVVTHFFSDSLSDSYEEILEVTTEGDDVRVRVIRISSATRYCGGQLVRAAERVLPHTKIRKLTGPIDICSFTAHDVTAALKAAAPKAITDTWDSATLSIVAECGAQQRVLNFPYPAQVDLKALRRDNPRVRDLWDLNYKVRSRAFGKHFSFHDLSAVQEKQFEDFGTKLLPELVSGRFDAGFGDYTCANQKCDPNYLAWRLRGYIGPPTNTDPAHVEIIDPASSHLLKYDLPQYPPIAKAAQLSGEVRLKILPDLQTGLVKDVHQLSGNPLLGSVAIDAARKWQFSSSIDTSQPVEVVLKFHLCHDE
jgi:hypothetical protein